MNINTSEEPETDQEELRSEVRDILRTWRKLKLTQKELLFIEGNLSTISRKQQEDLSEAEKLQMFALQKKLIKLRFSEVTYLQPIWSADEECWSQGS